MDKIYIDFNSQVRNILRQYINNYLESGLNIKNSAERFALDFNSFLHNPKQMVIGLYMLSVMYLDAYKIYSYKQKSSMLTEGDEEFLALLIDIEDQDDLINEANEDDFLVKLIMASYEFTEYNALAKINVVKELSSRENDWLNNRFDVHEQDLNHYDIEITLDFLVKNAGRHLKAQQKLGYFFEEGVVINIVGFIRNLLNTRKDNAIKLLLELIKVDYAASKYLIDKVSDNETFIDHIDLYENYSIDDMLEALTSNQAFLTDAIWMLLATNVFKQYDNVYIDSEVVKSKSVEEFNKKLILE